MRRGGVGRGSGRGALHSECPLSGPEALSPLGKSPVIRRPERDTMRGLHPWR